MKFILVVVLVFLVVSLISCNNNSESNNMVPENDNTQPEYSIGMFNMTVTEEHPLKKIGTDVFVPEEAHYLFFDAWFTQPGDGSWLLISLNDTDVLGWHPNLFIGKMEPNNHKTIEIPLDGMEGKTWTLYVSVIHEGNKNATFQIGNFSFYEFQEAEYDITPEEYEKLSQGKTHRETQEILNNNYSVLRYYSDDDKRPQYSTNVFIPYMKKSSDVQWDNKYKFIW